MTKSQVEKTITRLIMQSLIIKGRLHKLDMVRDSLCGCALPSDSGYDKWLKNEKEIESLTNKRFKLHQKLEKFGITLE